MKFDNFEEAFDYFNTAIEAFAKHNGFVGAGIEYIK